MGGGGGAGSSQDNEWWEAESILDKKQFNKSTYYLIKWKGWDKPNWEPESNLSCPELVREYERHKNEIFQDKDPDEWEVEEILEKRTNRKGKNEYLVKWRGWSGEPSWVPEEDCNCINLIAAFENPKLKKLWTFQGTNTKLWVTEFEMYDYIGRVTKKRHDVNVLRFLPDMPAHEERIDLKHGLNAGVVSYENHWYLIIILHKHSVFNDRVLIADSLNVLMDVKISTHPLYRRLKRTFNRTNIKAIVMSQQTRSDICGYYVLAAFERALFLLDQRAPFIIDEICVSETQAELIREQIRPDTHGMPSVTLPIPEYELNGPHCEFCKKQFVTRLAVDKHIEVDHFKPPNIDGKGGASQASEKSTSTKTTSTATRTTSTSTATPKKFSKKPRLTQSQ